MTTNPPQSPAASTHSPQRRGSFPLLRPHVLWAIFRRDFLGYFSNPAGYVFITLFVLASSWIAFGLDDFFDFNLANLDVLNAWMPYLLLVFIPAITMSIWAEERKQGTDELLLTLPAKDVEVVLGKYLAALGIFTIALLFSFSQVIVLMQLGRPDAGVMLATYLGYWLTGAMLIAFGMVASMLSSNATVAFILGLLLCAVPVFADLLGSMIAGIPALGGWLGDRIRSLSVPSQFADFGAGVVSFSGVFYFVSMAAAMLYINMVLLGRRHWAGGEKSKGLWLHYLTRAVALIVGLASIQSMIAYGGWRSDISSERLNTLSAESKQLIRSIPSSRPVFIQAYYSPEVPREYVQAKTDFLNILREIKAIGGDRIRLNSIEAPLFSAEAREAESKFGIIPRRVLTQDGKRQGTEEILLGAAFTSGPEEVVVPFIDRGLPVEYELVRSIRVVSGTARKKVAILQTDAKLLGGFDFQAMNQNNEWQIVTELKKQYEVSSVSPDSPIPADLDALVVAQPSSLTQPQIDTLIAYVKNGGPTLLFLDPLPYVDPSLAPLEPKMPPGGPFGGGPPPEPKGDLTPLLDLLGITWPMDQIVWNDYNPHPVLADAPREYLFVGQGSDAPGGAFGQDPVSSGLQEVVLLFAGQLRSKGGDLDFAPLLRTNETGGTLNYSEAVTRSFMGMTQLNRARPYFPTPTPYVLAAHVRGIPSKPESAAVDPAKKEEPAKDAASTRPLNAILISDLDLVSDTFFELRRRPSESLDFLNFDNVTLVLNCVDSLAGDESFIALRKRRPQHRTLEAVEAQTRTFIESSQQATKDAEDRAKAKLAEAQAALDKKVDEVRQRTDMDERTKDIMLSMLEQTENRRFEVQKATIEAERDKAKEEAIGAREQGVRGIHSRIKALAILLPPLPALILGAVVFFVRARRENRGASPNRLA